MASHFGPVISNGHFGRPFKLKTIKGKIKKTSERDYYGNRGVKYNWEGISKVVMQEKRTPTECRLKWRNVVHPDIKRDAWTDAEKSQLKKLVRKFGDQGTWAKVIWTHILFDPNFLTPNFPILTDLPPVLPDLPPVSPNLPLRSLDFSQFTLFSDCRTNKRQNSNSMFH